MKIAHKYFKPFSLLIMLALMVVSCTEFAEFESETYGPGPTITLSQVSVQDSTFTISVTSSADGSASVILLPGSGNTPPEDPADLATGNINAMDYQSKHVVGSTPTNFTFTGLVQYAIFEVMAVGTNLDGKYSEVSTLAVGTDDTHAPTLVSTSPAVGYSPVVEIDGSVILVFDEPVLYDDTKDLVFTEFRDGVDVVAGSVTVDFNKVTVTFGEDLTNRDYIMLSYPEGAFTDHSGNLAAGIESYFDGAGLVGLYWRAVTMVFEPISLTPEEDVVPSGFDIVVTFAEDVDADDVMDGDITLTYDDGLDVLTKAVLASEVSAAGNVLTITQSYAAAPGVVVTLNIPAELLGIGYGNPNAEVTASWSILHPLQAWIGSYDVDAASYAVPGDYDEAWTATIAPVSGDLNSLAITIDAGNGGGIPVLASINVGAGTITIAAGSDAGDLYTYGATLMYVGDYSTIDLVSPIVGTIDPDGTILIDEVAILLADAGDYYWDAFNTTWTPAAKKSASRVYVNPAKAARLK